MGTYNMYVSKMKNLADITAERKKTLSRISELRRGRDVLVIASDLVKSKLPIQIDYADMVPIADQLENLSGDAIDVIIETPGGVGEIVEDIVIMIRNKYKNVGIIIPGRAKSAGTIFAMAGDEILMGGNSSLGPIDGQMFSKNGQRVSADAILKEIKQIEEESEETDRLKRTYIPILRGISPGEIQKCKHVQEFSQQLVREWLSKYKFQHWKNILMEAL